MDNLLAGRTQESTFAEGVEQDQAERGRRKGKFVANSSPSPVKRSPKCRAGISSSQPAFLRSPAGRLRTLLGLGGRKRESFERRESPKPPAEPAASGGQLRAQSENKKTRQLVAPHTNPRNPERERPGGDAGGTRQTWRERNQFLEDLNLVRMEGGVSSPA